MFDTESVSLLQKINRHASDVTSCDISKAYSIATGSSDKTVVVYEWRQSLGYVETGYCPLKGHKYGVSCVRFSPSQSLLASASIDGHTNLWCLKTGRCLQSLVQANGNGVRVIAFSIDGSLLATAGEAGIFCLWTTVPSSFNLIRTVSGHDEESVQGVSISPDNMIVVTGDVTGSYKIWSVGLLKEDECSSPLITVRDAHDLGINSLDFSSQYTVHINESEGLTERCYLLASTGNDHCAGLWQVSIAQIGKGNDAPIIPSIMVPQLISKLTGHSSAISQGRISPRGDLLATASIDNTTRIWQISTGRCLKTLEGHTRYITSCAFSDDQSLVITGSNDRSAILWDLSGSRALDSLLPSGNVNASLYQVENNQERDESQGVQLLHKLEQHSSTVNSVHFGKEFLVSGGSDHMLVIRAWSSDGTIGDARAVEDAHRYTVHQVEVCPTSGQLVSCSLDGTAVLWDPETGMVKKSGWHVSGAGVRCVRFSPDSHLIAAGGDDDEVALYRSDTCQQVATMKDDGEGVMCLAFSFDSNFLLVGSADGHARLYCLMPTSTSPVAVIENCHDLGVTSMDFSQYMHSQLPSDDGKYEVATCGNDCLVKVWNVKSEDFSFSPLWTLSGHGGSVTCVRYSPQLAEMIASTATDKTCRLWDPYSGDCLYVVESHDGILTCCSFSPDATLLATGSIDKKVLIWALPKDLAFRSFIATRSNFSANVVEGWNVENVNRWLELFNLPPSNLTGSALLHNSTLEILDQLSIEDEAIKEEITKRIEELRKEPDGLEPPHEFLCPITHQLMRDPVIAADGETYERSAIESWLATGRNSSPMTNVILDSTKLESNASLRQSIANYLAI
ncbi:WD domain, G-beta repeat [Nesidiocoris tenuis]|uniref:WD domain, G-beta repeat n=1 Tax=Nesidiocoris tenuis TaxID=355587 RepID=A0ABN7AEH6_9HEMI|nr:WD domain, G-beta repeat [Nesidiocoris tenuis]